jgi:hypothetical protein
MDAAYYRGLACVALADAADAKDPAIAERCRERAQEYLLIAKALEDAERPAAGPKQQPQQQQQPQPKDDGKDER